MLALVRLRRRRASATDRFRLLLTPESGLAGQGTRYAIAGALVAGVYLASTTFLAVVIGLPFREALPIGFAVQLAVHFTLQRTFVWVHEEDFALAFGHQMRRYLLVQAAQFGLTAITTLLLPGPLGLSTEVVYLMTVGSMTLVNFLLFRNVVFHPAGGVGWSASRGRLVGRRRVGPGASCGDRGGVEHEREGE